MFLFSIVYGSCGEHGLMSSHTGLSLFDNGRWCEISLASVRLVVGVLDTGQASTLARSAAPEFACKVFMRIASGSGHRLKILDITLRAIDTG